MSNNSSVAGSPVLTGKDIFSAVLVFNFGWVAVVGNSVVLLTFFKYRHLRENDCIFLIACLALSDLTVGCGNISYAFGIVYNRIGDEFATRLQCINFSAILGGGMGMSQMAVAFTAFDRFSAFYNPMRYQAKEQKPYGVKCLLAEILVFILFAGLMYIGVDLNSVPPVCNASASTSEISTLIFTLFQTLCGTCVFVWYVAGYAVLIIKWRAPIGGIGEALKRQKKVTKAISIVLAAYLTFWFLPCFLLMLSVMFNARHLSAATGPIIGIGVGVNSTVNVFIYALKHEELRNSMKKLLCGSGSSSTTVTPININSKKANTVKAGNGQE